MSAIVSLSQFKKKDTIKVLNRRFRPTYYTWFSSIEPRLLFSKLEENNRFVDSGFIKSNAIDPLKIYQYQLASLGANLNVYKLHFPQIKLQWNVLNAGGYWFRARVKESTDTANSRGTPINCSYLSFGSNVIFRPDSRWGVATGLEWIIPDIWNSTYTLSNNNPLIQIQFDGHLKTSANGKLFFRYRWTFEKDNRHSNFTQLQLGYALNLFAGPPPKEAGK